MSTQNTPAASDPAGVAINVSNRRRWTIVWLLFFASLINYFDRQTLSFALPLIYKEFHLTKPEQGWLTSAFFWSYALMQIPMGIWVDRANLRWLYAGAFVLWSVAQAMTGLAGTIAALVVCRIVLGLGESIYLVGGTKVVSLFFPMAQRGLPCGVFDAGTRTGLVLEGLIIGYLLTHFGWRNTFVMVGLAALIWLLPWFLATPRQMRDTSAMPGTSKFSWKDVWALVRNRNMLGVLLGFFCFDYFWYFLIGWLPSYFVDVRKMNIMDAAIRAAVPMMVFGLCLPLGGWLADYFIRRGGDPARTRKTIISIGFLSGLLVIPAAATSSPDVALMLIAGSCMVGLSGANQLLLLQACAPSKQVGLAVGIYNFVGNMAGIVAGIMNGYVILWSGGSYTSAFVVAAVMLAASTLSYWFIVGPMREPPRESLTS